MIPTPIRPTVRRAALASFLALTAALAAAPAAPAQAPKDLDAVVDAITEDGCYETVQVLAGPDKQGRGTFSRGFERAAAFVEGELEALGYEPAGTEEGSYRWRYPLDCIVGGEQCRFEVAGPTEEQSWTLGLEEGFVPVPGSAEGAASGPAVFVGYAIDAPRERWVDLERRDVRGKVVFAFTREPRADEERARRFDGAEATEHSMLATKTQAAADAGAVALVLVPDPGLEADPEHWVPGVYPFVAVRGVDAGGLANRMRFAPIPVLTVSRADAGRLFGEDLDEYHEDIDRRRRAPDPLEAGEELSVSVEVAWTKEPRKTCNLAARLPGTGDSEEALVVGAHLDHVGYNVLFDRGRMRVHPGADDNASGSAALLEVARALAGTRPGIDVIFLWFSGEELGLLGSRAYCEDPVHPHERTVAMFNMDMVGRGDERLLNVGGLWDRERRPWAELVHDQDREIRTRMDLDFEQGRELYARSDQYSFHQKGVPALFFFEGDLQDNEVYHKPGDVPGTINAEKMERVARVFAACVWAVAHQGVRPE